MKLNHKPQILLDQVYDNITLAEACIHKKEYSEAEQHYLNAKNFLIQKDPGNYTALTKIWFDLGFNVYNAQGNSEKEKIAYQTVIDIFDKNPSQNLKFSDHRILSLAHWNLAETCLLLHEQNSAVNHRKTAIRLFEEIKTIATSKTEWEEVRKFNKALELVADHKAEKLYEGIFSNKNTLFTHEVVTKPKSSDPQLSSHRLGRKI